MSLRRVTLERIEQRNAGNVRHPASSSTILRKRILVLLLASCALIFTMGAYYRDEYGRRAGDWKFFGIGEVIVGVWLIYAVVRLFSETLKL